MTDEGDRVGKGGGNQKGARQGKGSDGRNFHSVYLIASQRASGRECG
jgi:hypothetical protein